MTTAIEAGRADLVAWQTSRSASFFEDDPNLERVLTTRLGRERVESETERLKATGRMVGSELSRLAPETNHDDYLPRLERFDGMGTRVESVAFHPGYHQAGRLIWQTGVLADYAKPGHETLQMALMYLISQTGEHGHNCPLACTAGLIKVLQRVGSDAQKDKWLPRLLDTNYDNRLHASQFLTEVQGGSDVGANAVRAEPNGEHWKIHGEKWFCSVIDAQLFLMTARPDQAPAGTRGLGLFVVPRTLDDGSTNAFAVRRLKRKLGTRAMASAEADFLGAHAESVGELNRGFKNVVEHVLDTSRVFNAICCAGSMRAAEREARSFAAHRRAFGKPIDDFPLVAESLATLGVEARAALASTLRITSISDRLQSSPNADLALAWRVAVNVNKYWTAVRNTQMVRLAIEVLGGNGVIETFTPLVQLYRDAMVLESWEGTHNVLVQQVLRDAERYGAHRAFLTELREALARLELPEVHSSRLTRVSQALDTLERAFSRLEAEGADQRFGRRVLDHAAVCLQLVALLEELASSPDDHAKAACVDYLANLHLRGEVSVPKPLPKL